MSVENSRPIHFYDELIEVFFNQPPAYEKTPPCPNSFVWRNAHYDVTEVLGEHRDFNRHGRMAHNMQPQHATRASKTGSWGVGRFFFQVRVHTGQIFELYYDRAPTDSDNRKGNWILYSERNCE